MSTPPRHEHVEIDRDRVLDDEIDVEPAEHDPPDHLDLPVETPEADAFEQELDVPIDDDDFR